jgi:hypothetical protein
MCAHVDVEGAMRKLVFVVPALFVAGAAAAQDGRPSALDPQAKVAPVQFRSAFEGYRSFADQELADWRKANDEVRAAAAGPKHK